MQAYSRGLPILTNQPERATRLVDAGRSDYEGTVGEPAPRPCGRRRDSRRRTPAVTGGTGLYLRAALAGFRTAARASSRRA